MDLEEASVFLVLMERMEDLGVMVTRVMLDQQEELDLQELLAVEATGVCRQRLLKGGGSIDRVMFEDLDIE